VTDIYPVTAVAAGVLGLVTGALVPRLIASVPEPEPDEPEEPEKDETGEAATDETEPEEPKELYADIAARPGLLWKCALASAVSAGAIGLVLGWSWSLLVVLPLVPVGVALAVVDWRTRMLPTRLIAPAYAVTLVAILVAWLADGRDLADLERAALGWLIYGGMFFLLWFIYPRGLGYGDVRLSGVLGLALGWVGWSELLLGIWNGLLLGGIIGGVLALVTRRRDYPFGPFMLVGALLAVVLGQPVMSALYG
jgi:leader peptidase (prepilin peptidase) / N-methyltransferase